MTSSKSLSHRQEQTSLSRLTIGALRLSGLIFVLSVPLFFFLTFIFSLSQLTNVLTFFF